MQFRELLKRLCLAGVRPTCNGSQNAMADSENPYTAPNATSPVTPSRRLGVVVGVTCLLICCVPIVPILREVVDMWQSLSESPSTSVRPVSLLILGLKWSGICVLIGLPLCPMCAWLAKRLGSRLGEELAVWSIGLCIAPVGIAFLAPFVIVPATGSSFGT
jgi:hypothetical protein